MTLLKIDDLALIFGPNFSNSFLIMNAGEGSIIDNEGEITVNISDATFQEGSDSKIRNVDDMLLTNVSICQNNLIVNNCLHVDMKEVG